MAKIRAEYDTETKKVSVFIDDKEVKDVSSCYFYNTSCYCGKEECCCCSVCGYCEVSTSSKKDESGVTSYTRLSANKKLENGKAISEDLYLEKVIKTPDLSVFFKK